MENKSGTSLTWEERASIFSTDLWTPEARDSFIGRGNRMKYLKAKTADEVCAEMESIVDTSYPETLWLLKQVINYGEIIDGHYIAHIWATFQKEQDILLQECHYTKLALQKFKPEDTNSEEYVLINTYLLLLAMKLAKNRDLIQKDIELVIHDHSSASMQHFQDTIAYFEEIEKENSSYTLTELQATQVCNLFFQDRDTANKNRRKLENEVWKVRARSNSLLREETAKENSPESAKYLGKLIQDRIDAVQTESAILDAFDTDFLTEHAMVLDRFARYELNPERKHR